MITAAVPATVETAASSMKSTSASGVAAAATAGVTSAVLGKGGWGEEHDGEGRGS